MDVFEILLVLNITALFYLAFDYIPRLERDVEKSYQRIAYLNKIKNKQIKSIVMQEIDEAINANKGLIEAFTTHRLLKVYLPLFLLAFPLLLIPLSIVIPIKVCALAMYNIWSLMLFFGIMIPFMTAVGVMIHNRPYSKYEKIHRKILSERDYENLLLD